MPHDAKKLLWDVLEAARVIEAACKGKTLQDFTSDKIFRGGIYYQFIIMGEGLARLRASKPEMMDAISESHRIIGFRNQVIHGYEAVDDEITWRVIQEKLPVVIREAEKLLAQ